MATADPRWKYYAIEDESNDDDADDVYEDALEYSATADPRWNYYAVEDESNDDDADDAYEDALEYSGKSETGRNVVTGILVDVSGSMRVSVDEDKVVGEAESWSRSTFTAIDNTIKRDVSSVNQVFALGFGAPNEPVVFDLLNTVEKVQTSFKSKHKPKDEAPIKRYKSKRELLKEICELLKDNGAPEICSYSIMNALVEVVSTFNAQQLLANLKEDAKFRKEFVQLLPRQCREGIQEESRDVVRKGIELAIQSDISKIISILETGGVNVVRNRLDRDRPLLDVISLSESTHFLNSLENNCFVRDIFVHCMVGESIEQNNVPFMLRKIFWLEQLDEIFSIAEQDGVEIRPCVDMTDVLHEINANMAFEAIDSLRENEVYRKGFMDELLSAQRNLLPEESLEEFRMEIQEKYKNDQRGLVALKIL
ncbi:unnamed protein product [Owenia fusiformis]|uniref:Uncharacterized protein n=1 Tax=Owenia fusiformis TaxID=6347 RepID=A0A8S4PH06_OWEFU|nr:unnamed protein product [Owenia fusiformis]